MEGLVLNYVVNPINLQDGNILQDIKGQHHPHYIVYPSSVGKYLSSSKITACLCTSLTAVKTQPNGLLWVAYHSKFLNNLQHINHKRNMCIYIEYCTYSCLYLNPKWDAL